MAFFGSRLSDNLYKTTEGFLVCKNVPIGRSGAIKYLDTELGIGYDNRIVTVYRNPEENNNLSTIASFEGKPVTDGHPDVDVDATNYNYYQKGHAQNIRADGDFLYADLFITDETLINQILNKEKREVSCGYDTIYKEYNGNLYQTNIRGNHIAIVDEGRAGKYIAIRDSKDTIIKNIKRSRKMKDVSKILRSFKKQIRDASTIEEVDDIVEETTDSLEDLIAEEPQAAEPMPIKDNPMAGGEPPMSQAGGDPITEVMQAIKSLNAKVDSLMTGKPQSDGTPEGDIDAAIGDLGQPQEPQPDGLTMDEDVIPEDDMGVTTSSAGKELEDVVSVDSAELEPSFTIEENETVAKDTAINILRNARKAIAGITNPIEKRKVADAILKSVKNTMKNKHSIGNVMAVANRKTIDSINESKKIENAYAKLNPHMSKKLGA